MISENRVLAYGASDFDFDDRSEERTKALNENLQKKIRKAQEETARQKADLNKAELAFLTKRKLW